MGNEMTSLAHLQQRYEALKQRETTYRKRAVQFIMQELAQKEMPVELLPFVYDEDIQVAQQCIEIVYQAIQQQAEAQVKKELELTALIRSSLQGGI